MARIRSIHPGLFTDEAFVSLSTDAQVLLFGLYTEADDQGVFEWKPLTLRMRLRPTKDGAIDPMLSEMEAVNIIKKYEANGRHYGALRNFRKYQRPKKPNAIHPINDEIRTYVALTAPSSELDDVEDEVIPQKGEIAPQMEEGGDKMEDEGGIFSLRSSPDAPDPKPLRPPKKPNTDVDQAFDAFNAVAHRANLPEVQKRTAARAASLRKRLNDVGGIEGWNAALEKLEASDFLCGRAPPRESQQPFRADIDFLLREARFTSLMEGKYDNRTGTKSANNGHSAVREAGLAAAERLAQRGSGAGDSQSDVAPNRC